jgi:uncharacterized membrane protein
MKAWAAIGKVLVCIVAWIIINKIAFVCLILWSRTQGERGIFDLIGAVYYLGYLNVMVFAIIFCYLMFRAFLNDEDPQPPSPA